MQIHIREFYLGSDPSIPPPHLLQERRRRIPIKCHTIQQQYVELKITLETFMASKISNSKNRSNDSKVQTSSCNSNFPYSLYETVKFQKPINTRTLSNRRKFSKKMEITNSKSSRQKLCI